MRLFLDETPRVTLQWCQRGVHFGDFILRSHQTSLEVISFGESQVVLARKWRQLRREISNLTLQFCHLRCMWRQTLLVGCLQRRKRGLKLWDLSCLPWREASIPTKPSLYLVSESTWIFIDVAELCDWPSSLIRFSSRFALYSSERVCKQTSSNFAWQTPACSFKRSTCFCRLLQRSFESSTSSRSCWTSNLSCVVVLSTPECSLCIWSSSS